LINLDIFTKVVIIKTVSFNFMRFLSLLTLFWAVVGYGQAEPVILRVGFFPNLTHSPALAARQLEREGADWHLANLPKGSKIEWRSFNAGPSAMEALLAGAVDLTYVGPSPVINAHVRTKGNELRILAPVARAGNALVVRKGLGLKTPKDFIGRRVATPQLGNTQDIDARVWLRAGGLTIKVNGGDAQVIPAQNAELVLLFSRGDVDAAWTTEPWVTRLTSEFGGEILIEKKDAIITVLASSKTALAKNGKGIEAFVRSHYALRDKLLADQAWHEKLIIAGLGGETRSTPPKATLIGPALGRVIFDAREEDAARKARLTAAFTHALKDSKDSGLLNGDAPIGPLLESLVSDAPAAK
jgi:NitT/TauT family transport system substrate-binding protein